MTLLAYFGPETYLPFASVIATVVGVVLMFGKNIFHLARSLVFGRSRPAIGGGPWRDPAGKTGAVADGTGSRADSDEGETS